MIDTNVLVAAVLSPDGAAREVLRRCLTGKAQPLIGNALFLEYEDVLSRDDLFAAAPIGREDRAILLDAVLSVCLWINITFLWRPNLPDESDNHLIELAVAGNAELIITSNVRDVAAGELVFDGLRIVTPGAWLKEDY
ncbi:MAG: putative toxin-antitoxin system toxin component, PIN family [Bryobacterales bacterium]|nr:putative toxin-antitoxin system toxin component, PIN family [Bryobacterales bacterium]